MIINNYDELRPSDSMYILLTDSDGDWFYTNKRIFNLSDINDWCEVAGMKKRYWVDVSLHMKAYQLYIYMTNEQCKASDFVSDIIKEGTQSKYYEYYKKMLRSTKLSKLI